jgi:hypothetical protein
MNKTKKTWKIFIGHPDSLSRLELQGERISVITHGKGTPNGIHQVSISVGDGFDLDVFDLHSIICDGEEIFRIADGEVIPSTTRNGLYGVLEQEKMINYFEHK